MKQWLKKYRIPVSLVPVALVMGMIFAFSAQNGETSGALSSGITRWVLGVAVPNWENLPATEQVRLLDILGLVIRKMAHFSEYALLGACLMLHIRQIQTKVRLPLPWLVAWGVGTAYAATDELHQGLVGGRHPAVTDVCIDSSGVIAGVGMLLLVLFLLHRRTAVKPGTKEVPI